MRANLQREIAAAALAGRGGSAAVLELLTKGLETFRGVRLALRDVGLNAGIGAMRGSRSGRDYVRVALPRGVTMRLLLAPSAPQGMKGMVPLVTIHPARGFTRSLFDVPPAAAELARRAGTDVETAARIVLGIERARKRCYELCEEGTRWI